jgi:hypothetical protein
MRRCYYSPLVPLFGILTVTFDFLMYVWKDWPAATFITDETEKFDFKFFAAIVVQSLSVMGLLVVL